MRYTRFQNFARTLAALVAMLMAGAVHAQSITPFVGKYTGTAELEIDGAMKQRDLSVSIEEDDPGFSVDWSTVTYREDGESKEKSYSVSFLPSDRTGIFGAAMKKNVFGKAVPLDPMKGEPYVWGRIEGDTLTVYSLHVHDQGGYDLQQFDRTLAEGGLQLEFKSVRNGEVWREISAFLKREAG